MKFISSRDNALFKQLRGMLDDARARRDARATLIDGDHLLEAAIQANWPVRRLIVREDVAERGAHEPWLKAIRAAGLPEPEQICFNNSLFRQLSPVVTPTGLLAEIPLDGPAPAAADDDDVLVLAGVQDAGNLGTLLRSAVAAGIRQVWLDAQCTQAWSPKAMRAGMGAQFRVSIAENCDLAGRLAADTRTKFVTSLGEGCVSLYATGLRSPNIWVFGSEGQGVPQALIDLADVKVRIPMPGHIESLNVGAAAAVCLFEQVRQRGA